MNSPANERKVDPSVWQESAMLAALGRRDIKTVFTLLQQHGVSQRRIAAMTGQAQPEVSDIMRGRIVKAYDVLSRIADGLGIPRGLMGLAYVRDPPGVTNTEMPAEQTTRGELLGVFTKLAAESALSANERTQLVGPPVTPAPMTVRSEDVDRVDSIACALWKAEKSEGGGPVRDGVQVQLHWVRALRRAPHDRDIEHRLQLLHADLLSLAGWAAHDMNVPTDALSHLGEAAAIAGDACDSMRVALVFEQIARVYLRDDAPEALKMIQLAGFAANRSASPECTALTYATEARVHATLGDARRAADSVSRSRDVLADAGDPGGRSLPEYRRFDPGTLAGEEGRVHTILSQQDKKHATRAIDLLTIGTGNHDPRIKRRAINLLQLAVCLFRLGDPARAAVMGRIALDLAAGLRSRRFMDYVGDLASVAVDRHHPAAGDLAEQLMSFVGRGT